MFPIETETTYTNQLTKCTGWIEQKKGIGIKSSPADDIYVAWWMLLPKQDETMNTALTRCLEALGYVVYPPKNHGISTPLERDGSNGGGISAA